MASNHNQQVRNEFYKQHKENLRVQAGIRQEFHDALTLEQKLTKLDNGGHTATRERTRLLAQIAARDAAKAAPAKKAKPAKAA
jgi:hypothetical protein